MDYIIVTCPHCETLIFVYKSDLNCRIFRHASLKSDNTPIDPHSSKEVCDKLLEENLINGCSKPFRINAMDIAEICEYI
jgi:hypothetical protein